MIGPFGVSAVTIANHEPVFDTVFYFCAVTKVQHRV